MSKTLRTFSECALKSLLFLCFTSISTIASTASTKSQKLVTKLIHYDYIFAPSHKYNVTTADHAEHILQYSNARFSYLQSKSKKNLMTSDVVEINILPDPITPWFVVNFSVGQPPSQQLAIMDTGSSLTWIQCTPCEECFPQQGRPIFDPSKSYTFAHLPCDHSSCGFFSFSRYVALTCNTSTNNCLYSTQYEDGSMSTGRLATDRFSFETSDGGIITTPEVVFGCGQRNTERKHGMWNGVFGLGDTPGSIVNKLGGRFSYCLGNVKDPLYDFNKLAIGIGVSIEGYSTRLEKDDSFYYVTLEGISVGDNKLELNPNAFKKKHNGGGVILDSGTVLSYLPATEYNILKEKVVSLLEGYLTRVIYEHEPRRLCYSGKLTQDLLGFPVTTFHLAEGVDLVLDAESMFYHTETNVFCMSVLPFEGTGNPIEASVIGIMAQQNYNVVYDLIGERIYFQRIDCELLDD